ncbi:MAG: lipocalin family protein [Muribaculaceae bacterium]|nr:lipocalin family protein [Muribaculaceae bacterium]
MVEYYLARTPQISDEIKDKILAEAQRRGYDTDKLIWIKQ